MTSDRHWRPALVERSCYDRRPPVDAVIGFRGKPYRVLAIDDVHPVNWTDEEREAWQQDGMPDPWSRAPFRVRVQPLPSGRPHGMRVGPQHYVTWHLLPEHYAVCVTCGEVAPCSELTGQRQAEREMVRFERLASILPGCCWACSEPITSRQKSLAFEGGNVWMPTAPSPLFHDRQRCRSSAATYEEAWVAADPRRARSLLTLRCTGSVVVHHDGTGECLGAAESDCPDIRARHMRYNACYLLTHGCPRDCPRDGHPGATLRRRP
jgi:hypothetical protein